MILIIFLFFNKEYDPIPGASGFKLSNDPVFSISLLFSSLNIFNLTSMREIRAKSILQITLLDLLFAQEFHNELYGVVNEYLVDREFLIRGRMLKILSPKEYLQKGSQLSLFVNEIYASLLVDILRDAGVIVDLRKPSTIRISVSPMYNTFAEILIFVKVFRHCFNYLKVNC